MLWYTGKGIRSLFYLFIYFILLEINWGVASVHWINVSVTTVSLVPWEGNEMLHWHWSWHCLVLDRFIAYDVTRNGMTSHHTIGLISHVLHTDAFPSSQLMTQASLSNQGCSRNRNILKLYVYRGLKFNVTHINLNFSIHWT